MDKALNYLALARKAGLAELGEEPVGAITRAGKGYLVLVASDASDHTWRRAKSFVAGTSQCCVRLPFTKEEMDAYLATITGVALGSDAFFPFGDNIERAKKSGVSYIAEPGGSIRDDIVIDVCNKYGIAMAFTGMRLFHH